MWLPCHNTSFPIGFHDPHWHLQCHVLESAKRKNKLRKGSSRLSLLVLSIQNIPYFAALQSLLWWSNLQNPQIVGLLFRILPGTWFKCPSSFVNWRATVRKRSTSSWQLPTVGPVWIWRHFDHQKVARPFNLYSTWSRHLRWCYEKDELQKAQVTG